MIEIIHQTSIYHKVAALEEKKVLMVAQRMPNLA
jgi:hypothetical protein